jgi:hypothetical protein
MKTEYSRDTTVGELAQPGVVFFRELIDCDTTKCYGIQHLTAEEVQLQADRIVGFYGQRVRTFTEPFEIQRGHRIVVVRCSVRRPLRCFEHVYAEI